jgi:hypothetical protein
MFQRDYRASSMLWLEPRPGTIKWGQCSRLLLAAFFAASPAVAAADCKDPLPINPEVVTKQLKLKAFTGANQFGPVCQLAWAGPSSPTLMIYGPSAMAGMGRKFTSAKQAAEQYSGESPKGVEPLPGVGKGFMVFDPKTPNRRLFVEYQKQVYMIVSQDKIPVEIIAQAVIQR